jgi:hypothetical protein
VSCDSDGDIISRRPRPALAHIELQHELATPLSAVGLQVRSARCSSGGETSHRLPPPPPPDGGRQAPPARLCTQVWRGACLVCDYLLHTRQLAGGERVLDLGAGAGRAWARRHLLGPKACRRRRVQGWGWGLPAFAARL